MLRSYDSRKEPAPEFDCKIWEAGRATCAIGLAFKPIQIGQSVFHDDGAGTFNPSITALDEATVNEWPGREVGVFVSVGTGKRPKGSDANSSLWYEGFLGEFADARRKLIAKIEGCEKIHEMMIEEHLPKRNVNIENYYRLNVEVGVGEFGMNEWHRLAEISTNTRRYLSREAEQKIVQGASAKLGKIYFAKQRWERLGSATATEQVKNIPEISQPLAVELPGDLPAFAWNAAPARQSYESGQERLPVPGINTPSPRSSGERLPPSPLSSNYMYSAAPQTSAPPPPQGRPTSSGIDDADRLMINAPTPAQYRTASGSDKIAIVGPDDYPRRYQQEVVTQQQRTGTGGPPLPPKTPLLGSPQLTAGRRSSPVLPYPLDEDAPPAVNLAKKPNYVSR